MPFGLRVGLSSIVIETWKRVRTAYLADMLLESFHSVIAQYKPELEGAETASESNLPISIIDH